MKFIKPSLTVIFMTIVSSLFASNLAGIIPVPVSMTPGKGYFRITAKSSLLVSTDDKAVKDIALLLNNHLKEFYHFYNVLILLQSP